MDDASSAEFHTAQARHRRFQILAAVRTATAAAFQRIIAMLKCHLRLAIARTHV